MDVVDAHTHIVSADVARYPLAPPVPGTEQEQDWHRTHPVDAEAMLSLAAAAGVRGVAFVQSISCHGFDNRYVLDAAAAHHGRAIAVGAVHVDDPDAPALVQRLVADHGMHGVRVMAAGVHEPIDTGAARGVVRAASDTGIPVVLLAIASQLASVPSLVRAFPEVTFVLDHCGFADLTGAPALARAGALLALADSSNVVLKVSSITLQSVPEPASVWPALVSRFGADRLLWGTDHPHTHDRSYAGLVDLARTSTAPLAEPDRALVLAGTARRVWPAFGR